MQSSRIGAMFRSLLLLVTIGASFSFARAQLVGGTIAGDVVDP